jgi:hypothetical protein
MRPDAVDRRRARAETPSGREMSLLRRRWPTAVGVLFSLIVFADGRPDSLANFALMLAGMPAAYLAFGAARGEFHTHGSLEKQLLGLAMFGAIANATLALDEGPERYVLAAGWLGHALWDVAHHRSRRVVPWQYAEWCAVVDVAGAVAFVVLP